MKYIVSILVILAFISCSRDREIIPLKKTSFEKTFGADGNDELKDIIENNGQLVVCGYIHNTVGAAGKDGWLAGLDKEGVVLWQQTFGGAGDQSFQSLIRMADGGYLLTGSSTSSGSEDLWLMRLNAGGLLVWEKKHGGALTDFGMNSIELPDGNLLVSGTTESFGKGSLDHWLLKLNANGDTISTKTFGDNSIQGYGQIMTKNDGNYFVSGRTDKNGNADIDILEVTANLDSVNEIVFGSSEYEEAKNVIALSDGNYIVAAHSAGFGNPEHNVYAVKFDEAGNMKWEKTYGTSYHDGPENILKISENKILILARSHGNNLNNEDAYFIQMDKNGNEQHNFFRGGALMDQLNKSIFYDDYIFSVGRAEIASGNSDAWLIAEPVSNF
jgi:hypothetical protein